MIDVVQAAQTSLRGPRHFIPEALAAVPDAAGLYAIYGDARARAEIGLPDSRDALYVGKAEESLVSRDLKTHFATGKTGSSTVRRTFAALLRDPLALRAVPRNLSKPDRSANYGLAAEGDVRLTAWMHEHLALAVWLKPQHVTLRHVELAVLASWEPPLNLRDVPSPWKHLQDARAVMAAEARAWSS